MQADRGRRRTLARRCRIARWAARESRSPQWALGGYHLGSAKNQQEANEIVAEAMDAGVNFFDNAWDYHDGHSEEVFGIALRGKRSKLS